MLRLNLTQHYRELLVQHVLSCNRTVRLSSTACVFERELTRRGLGNPKWRSRPPHDENDGPALVSASNPR